MEPAEARFARSEAVGAVRRTEPMEQAEAEAEGRCCCRAEVARGRDSSQAERVEG
jgi:hypothetical protein